MKNAIKASVKDGLSLLKNPVQGFLVLKKRCLEDVVGNYLKLLILVGFVAALFNLVFGLARTFFFDITRDVEIDYLLYLNFLFSQSFSFVFVYFLVGTFILFILSSIIYQFYKKTKYTEFLKVVLYSIYPLLLFGWLPFLAAALSVWCIFLFVVGIKSLNSKGISKGSLDQRE